MMLLFPHPVQPMNILQANRTPSRGPFGLSGGGLTMLSGLILLLAGVFWATGWAAGGLNLEPLQQWLDSMGRWAPMLFVLISIAMMSTVAPKTAISVLAGILFGTALGSLLMLMIAVSAAGLNYAIGRYCLRGTALVMLGCDDNTSRPENNWRRVVMEMAAEAGFGLHLLIRLSPVPTMVISYTMGALHGRLAPYLSAAAVAILPQVLWVHSGSAAMEIHSSGSSTLRWMNVGLSVLVALLISILVPQQARRRMQSTDLPPEALPTDNQACRP